MQACSRTNIDAFRSWPLATYFCVVVLCFFLDRSDILKQKDGLSEVCNSVSESMLADPYTMPSTQLLTSGFAHAFHLDQNIRMLLEAGSDTICI